MSAAKPCYSPMLAGSTLYREKAERNKKKHCFHTTFASPMELFPRLCVVGFQLTRSARRRQADTAPCCDEPEYHAAWIILRQAKGSTLIAHPASATRWFARRSRSYMDPSPLNKPEATMHEVRTA